MKKKRILFSTAVCMLALSACTILPRESAETLFAEPTAAVVTPQSNSETELALVLQGGDFAQLDEYPMLKVLDLSGSTCYEEIAAYATAHPDIEVRYTVTLSGNGEAVTVSAGAAEAELPNESYFASLTELAPYLPKLASVTLTDHATDADALHSLREAMPELLLSYNAYVGGKEYSMFTEKVDLSDLSSEALRACASQLALLPNLNEVELTNGEGESMAALEDAELLAAAIPWASIHYSFELFEQQVSLSDERLEFVKTEIGPDGLQQLRELLPHMTKLSYLKLDDCTVYKKWIPNSELAQLRDEFPEIKVVWRVHFSGDDYNCLTDTEKIWATGTVTDGFTEPLKYCTEVRVMDMGHNCITNIDFINYMPKLEVAVLSITWIRDLSPLGNCPELEFLEIYSSEISDVSALANCTKLKHLNLGNDKAVKDITPLYGLELERFYFNNNELPKEQMDEFIRLHPDCETSFGYDHPVHTTWRFLPGYTWKQDGSETHYCERYALLREQIGYDTYDYSR